MHVEEIQQLKGRNAQNLSRDISGVVQVTLLCKFIKLRPSEPLTNVRSVRGMKFRHQVRAAESAGASVMSQFGQVVEGMLRSSSISNHPHCGPRPACSGSKGDIDVRALGKEECLIMKVKHLSTVLNWRSRFWRHERRYSEQIRQLFHELRLSRAGKA